MNIIKMSVADIKPSDYNPRVTLTKKDFAYQALEKSVNEFGLVVPLIINGRTNTLISGHQRLMLLKEKGVEETEVVVVDLPESKAKALCVAMNKISGKWNYGMLAEILEELVNIGEDISSIGFSKAEIQELLGEFEVLGDVDVPVVPKKNDKEKGIKCVIGEYEFRIEEDYFSRIMADIREKVGFTKEKIENELKRRLLRYGD